MKSTIDNRAIGLFDSGIGGLTVLGELQARFPNENFIYLGDTARTPYGTKGPETILRYSKECAQFLLGREIKALVVACNTSSAVALETLKNTIDVPVIGTIEPAVRHALSITKGIVGVIGTRATIATSVYESMLKSNTDKELKVFSKACPLFVPFVEEGVTSGDIIKSVIAYYLESVRSFSIDTLILACTHYPLLKAPIQDFFGSEVDVIECSKAIGLELDRLFQSGEILRGGSDREIYEYFATDDVDRFNSLANLFLADGRKSKDSNRKIRAKKIEISDLAR